LPSNYSYSIRSQRKLEYAKAVRNQNQAGKIAVFGSDMTTEIAQELENNQVLKAVVDISGKKMGNAVFAQTLKVINMDFSEFVFLNRKGEPTKNSAYDTTLFKLCDKAGIRRFSPRP
jgi:23S rRNA pseudoU1915 N3-methylase RlmH